MKLLFTNDSSRIFNIDGNYGKIELAQKPNAEEFRINE